MVKPNIIIIILTEWVNLRFLALLRIGGISEYNDNNF